MRQSPRPGWPIGEFVEARELEAQVERLLTRLRIAVVFGGNKSVAGSVIFQAGNSRSWKSYEEVAGDIAGALKRIGFHHVELVADDMRFLDHLRRSRIDIAWLNTGGVQGSNPTAHAASMLEMAGLPYIGQEPLAATTLDNKHAFKAKMVCAGIPTAAFSVWDMGRGVFRPEINSRFRRAFGDYPGPFVVKPVSGRASLHVHFVDEIAGLADAVREVYEVTRNLVLIEQYLPGREFCVAVCGPVIARAGQLLRGRSPVAFGAIERTLDGEEKIFTSMDNRPITAQRFRVLERAREEALIRDLHRLGSEVFLEFNLNSITRIDIREAADGRLDILEANPKPDLTRPADGRMSLISAGLPDCGMTYEDLILSLFSDRLDFLLRHRPGCIAHVIDLLESRAVAAQQRASAAEPAAADAKPAPGRQPAGAVAQEVLAQITAAVTDANVSALGAVMRAARGSEEEARASPAAAEPASKNARPMVTRK